MRWVIGISIVLLSVGTGLLIYASKIPAYTDAGAVERISQELEPKMGELKSINERINEWYLRVRVYETPEKRISDLGRGLLAAGMGLLAVSWLWSAYHKYPWMRRTGSVRTIWVSLWVVRFPLTVWYYGFRSYRLDYPPWADSIAIPIFSEWLTWIAGAFASMAALLFLLPNDPLPASIRWLRPTSRRRWTRVLIIGCWIAGLGACVAFGIPGGNEGQVFTCLIAAAILLAFATTDKVVSLKVQCTPELKLRE